MDKAQALYEFWNGFGWAAYDENTVPMGENAPALPYITYSTITDSLGYPVQMNASLWSRGTSWAELEQKKDEISRTIDTMYPPAIKIDDGRIYITRGNPFAQRMSDEDPFIRRIYLNIQAEFFTAH